MLFLYCTLTFLILIAVLPIIIVAVTSIIIIDNQNPLYLEKRSGLFGKPFTIIKLRTMKFNHNKTITKLGGFLRFSKIDELTQIFNVVMGQMSLVGPRPLYPEYNAKYTNFEMKRLNVKPGITGLAQIKVTDTNNWRHKFKYDVFYADKKTVAFDFYILRKTFFFYLNILLGKKIIKENHDRFGD